MHNKNGSQRLVGEVQMFRIRIATAESKLKVLREQSRQAKRRRKVAKRTAQRARNQFKRFKADVAELRRSLAKAEWKLLQAGGRAMARKMATTRPVANRGARPLKKSKPIARKPRLASPRKSRDLGRTTRRNPAITKIKVVSGEPAGVAALDPTLTTPPNPRPELVSL